MSKKKTVKKATKKAVKKTGKKAVAKMDGKSITPNAELIKLLQAHCPEIFTEGKVDLERFGRSQGQAIADGRERYGLNWAGKNDCFRHIQEPTTATLKPIRKESIDFNNTENLFIEGDNLQVLKVLQKSYYGKIKMIYIDPPYNTGNDSFIYPDRFQETQDEYLQRIGDKDVEGNLIADGFFRKNTKESGHFHSNWLSMMYPRLFLARNLLREDGVIFVSIDDNEVHNLRMIMNEIFGEQNFVEQIIWKKRSTPPNDKIIGAMHEYILIYAKNIDFLNINLRERNKEQVSRYTNPDNHPKGPWTSGDLMANIKGGRYVHSLYFPIINPKTGEEHYPSSNGNWRFNREKIQKLLDNNEIYFGENGTGRPKLKRFLSDVKQGITYTTLWDFVPFNTQGSKEMTELLGNLAIFDNPKPVGLMLELLRLGSDEESIVLDFFAGSCSISQAVMRINTEDTGKRKYICIQLPEPCPEDSQASKADFKNVAEIGKERIRRASKKIAKDSEGKFDFKDCKLDLGFKVFKLGESNFKIWRTDIDSPEVLEQQMELFVDNTKPDTLQENVLYELIVKAGLDLNVSVEKKTVNRKDYFLVDGGRMVVCLENKITQPLVDKILEYKPEKVICLDKSFEGNDQLKTNTALQMEAEKIDFKVI